MSAGPAERPRHATLFVSALAWAELPGALASGADIVCLDLEDPVPASRKGEARDGLLAMIANVAPPAGVQLAVRINTLRSCAGLEDLSALLHSPGAAGAIVLPMARGADAVSWVGRRIDDAGLALDLLPIIETPEAVEHCFAIALAHPRVVGLFFGANDLSRALGCTLAWENLLYARSRLVQAGAAAGVPVFDAPSGSADDLDGLRRDCDRARVLGMRGKGAKHLRQVATIIEVFSAATSSIPIT